MLLPLINHVNDLLNIRRSDSQRHILNYLKYTTLTEAKQDAGGSIYGFFKDVVMGLEWTRVINENDLDVIYRRIDSGDNLGKMYFKYLDIFDRAIKTYLDDNKIDYSSFITEVVSSMCVADAGNTKRTSILAKKDTNARIFKEYTWLTTIYILANTDLYYILSIDMLIVLLESNQIVGPA